MSCFNVFTFELLHNLHLEISELVRMFTVKYFLFYRLGTGGAKRGVKSFVKTKLLVPLRACDLLLNATKRDEYLPSTRTDSSKQWRQLYRTKYLQGMSYVGCLKRGLPFIRKIVSSGSGILRSKCGMHEDDTYDDGANTSQ